jgi:hypothetical protein
LGNGSKIHLFKRRYVDTDRPHSGIEILAFQEFIGKFY